MRSLPPGAGRRGALALAGAVTLQATLGILTLLAQAPLWLALMHQGMAMIVLTVAVLHAQSIAAKEDTRLSGASVDRAERFGVAANG